MLYSRDGVVTCVSYICGKLRDMDVQYKIFSHEKMLENVFHQQFSDIPGITPSFLCSQGGKRQKWTCCLTFRRHGKTIHFLKYTRLLITKWWVVKIISCAMCPKWTQ